MNVPQTRNQNLPADPNTNPYTKENGFLGPSSTIVGHLLKFTKFGEFTAGQDNVAVPHGTELIAHMGDLLVGWQRWEDNKPVEQVMGFVRDNFQPPKRADLGYTDKEAWEIDDNGKERDPWQKTAMLILKGVDNDELYTFSTSSKGGLSEIDRLRKAYGEAMRFHPDQFPVVQLDWDSYPHPNKTYGEIRTPVFEIVNWVPREEIDRALKGEAPIDSGPAPAAVEQKPAELTAAQREANRQAAQRELSTAQRKAAADQRAKADPQVKQAAKQQQARGDRGPRF